MAVPNVHYNGATIKVTLNPLDTNGDPITSPDEARITLEAPDGTLTTVSGVLTYTFDNLGTGWYIYEGWVRKGTDETALSQGFTIVDRI